jgi:PhzF family phenazine biosynthesis protein
MELDIYVVDAFTDTQFKGNSAAVVPLEEWLAPELMQSIATENNLSETAFLKSIGANQYEIRWFSPITEIDFCGHATLASSLVLFDELGISGTIEFHTLEVGTLTVEKNAQGKIEMTFPVRPPKAVSDIPSALIEGLSCDVERVLLSPQAYFVVVDSHIVPSTSKHSLLTMWSLLRKAINKTLYRVTFGLQMVATKTQ